MVYYINAPIVSQGGLTLSRVPAISIPELITRFLDLNEGRNGSEVARAYGLDQGTISKWRRGQRPTQLQEQTRRKLAAALGLEGPRDDGTLLAFAAGVLWGVERDARHIAETARAARERLGFSDEAVGAARETPTAPELVAGLAALSTAERARREGGGPPGPTERDQPA